MSSVSDTAYAIAAIRALEAELPASERLFEDRYAAIFRPVGPRVADAAQRFLELPFMREGVRLRTRFIDDFVRDGLASGLRQVVLLGAGFDARGLRMQEVEAAGATVFEVDLAQLLDVKRGLLAAAGVALPPHVALIASDFADAQFPSALEERLEASGFRRGAGALFVWEGVIAYIDDAAIERSLAFMVRAGGPGTRVVFDYSDVRFDPVPAAERVRRAGFGSFESVGADELWRRHLPGDPLAAAAIVRMGIAVVASS